MEFWKLHSLLIERLVEEGYTKPKAVTLANNEMADMVKKGCPTPLMKLVFGKDFKDYGIPKRD